MEELILTFPKECLGNRVMRPADISAGEFYDLKADPKEWNSLYTTEAARVERDRMSTDLVAHLNRPGVRKAAGSE